MKERYQLFYNDMLKDIERSKTLLLSDLEELEVCFKCSANYWYKLSDWIKIHGFINEAAEKDFFKNVKPQFTGRIEFYALRYHAAIFMPDHFISDKLDYWNKTLKRIEAFFVFNQNIYKYYKSNETGDLYLREYANESNVQFKLYTIDPETTSCYDHLLAGFVVNEFYREFVEGEIEKLTLDSAPRNIAGSAG